MVDSFDYENRRAIDSEIIDNENSETMTKIDDTSAEIRRSRKRGWGGGRGRAVGSKRKRGLKVSRANNYSLYGLLTFTLI